MAVISVADWVPDAADLGNPGAVTIINAVPGPTGYKPMPRHTALTGALTARARGAIEVRDKDLDVYQFAGDATKIYKLSSTTWSDVSLSGGYATGTEEIWEFVRWKNQVLATNFTDDPQYIEVPGTLFADLTTAFRCRRLAVVRDFVVAGNTYDVTDGNVPDRVRWSAFSDETDWTVSPVTGADYRDLKRGPIQKMFGGEYGVIMTKTSTFRMSYEGAPTWFRMDETIPGIGTIAPGAAAQLGNVVYTLSEQGFYAIQQGTGATPIGVGRTDEFVRDDLDDEYLYRMSAVADPTSGRIYWAYPGSGNTGGEPNRIIVYDTGLNKWSLIHENVEILWSAAGIGYTLEQLDTFSSDIDALGVSLDSSQWKGGASPLLAAFDPDHKHGFFDGAPMDAVIDTQEAELFAGHRTRINAFNPLVDGGAVTAQIGERTRQTDSYTFGPVLTQSASGRFTKRSNSRFHRFRLNITGEWNDCLGVEIDKKDARKAEHRG